MKTRIILTCLLASTLLPAALVSSHTEQEVDLNTFLTPPIDWNGVSGVMWAQRNISVYVLAGQQSSLFGAWNSGGQANLVDSGTSIISGGFNLFTTANTDSSSQLPFVTSNTGVGINVSESGNGSSPGWLLAEWNTVPVVNVVDRGIPAIDNFPREYSPGGLLAGFGEDFRFVPGSVLLSGGVQSIAPQTLNPGGLALRGVNPEAFGGVTSNVASAPVAPVELVSTTTSSAPTVLSSPLTVSSPTAAAPKSSEPTLSSAAVAPQAQTPVVTAASSTPPPPQTIASVAEAFMTTTVSSSVSPGGTAGLRPNLIGNSIIPLDSPEPGAFAVMGLGVGLVAWKVRRRR